MSLELIIANSSCAFGEKLGLELLLLVKLSDYSHAGEKLPKSLTSGRLRSKAKESKLSNDSP